jgi:uncharacterized protein YdhG (YjbR/CyaY superfamily)
VKGNLVTETKKASGSGFTAEERAAMRERNKELKSQQRKDADLAAVLDKIAGMTDVDCAMATKVHEIATGAITGLDPRLWYGSPAYYKDGKLICFFQDSGKFKTRYATLGFSDNARLDEGTIWPSSYALTEVTAAVEKQLRELVSKAIG